MQNTFRTRILGVSLALVAVLATPVLLFAHARLVRSTPAAGATLDVSPSALTLWFSERPELRFSTLQLLDSTGKELALGTVAQLTGDAMAVTSPIPAPLANGTYTVVWRTAAADGHATTGRFAFVVAIRPADTTAAQKPPVVITRHIVPSNVIVQATPSIGIPTAVRWLEFVGLFLLVGAVAFRLVVLRNAGLPPVVAGDAADRTRRLASSGLLLFIIATAMRLQTQSTLIPDSAHGRFDAMLSVVRGTTWGHGWLIGACGAVLCIVGLAVARWTIAGWIGAAIGAIGIAGSEALTGHAGASVAHVPLAVAIDVAHLLGAGSWIGGLTMVLLAGLPSLRPLNEGERIRAGSRVVRAYHATAVESVAIVLLTALVAAWLRLGSLDALWTTSYGNMLLRKIFFVVVVLGFGFYHRRAVVLPDWDTGTGARFRRSATGELLMAAVVLAFTALLVSTALPTQ